MNMYLMCFYSFKHVWGYFGYLNLFYIKFHKYSFWSAQKEHTQTLAHRYVSLMIYVVCEITIYMKSSKMK